MPARLTFDIPDDFNLTIKIGSNSLSLLNGSTNVQSNSSNNEVLALSVTSNSGGSSSSSSSNNQVSAPSPSHGTRRLDPSPGAPRGALEQIPPEVRTMIYVEVLVYVGKIRTPYIFLGHQLPMDTYGCEYIEFIDAALLCTCRAIYNDAVGILYGMNHFVFRSPQDIKQFAHHGLGTTSFGFHRTANEPPHALSSTPYGRLTMIRIMTLEFCSAKGKGSCLIETWLYWLDVFYPSGKQDQLVGFPALEVLVLDFRQWRLEADEEDDDDEATKIRVKPFLRLLRPAGGLRHLTVIGLEHEQNLRDFKHGFVKEGGTFRPALESDETVATTVVTHEDLPEVSLCVRALVETDKASRARLTNEHAIIAA